MALNYFNNLLAKAVIKRARTGSVAHVMEQANQELIRAGYVLAVLKAPGGTRSAIQDAALASDSEGQQQLAATLCLYEALSPANKVDFMAAFAGCATVAGLGTRAVAYQTTWQWNHIPPRLVP